MFKESYKDHLRKFRKLMKQKQQLEQQETPHYDSYLFNLSLVLPSVEPRHLYKKYNAHNHEYIADIFTHADGCVHKNQFIELLGYNGWLKQLNQNVYTSDGLTAYWFIHTFVKNRMSAKNVLLVGYHQDVHEALIDQYKHSIGGLTFYTVDKKQKGPQQITALDKSSDISSVDTLNGIRNYMDANIDKAFDIIYIDIANPSLNVLLSEFILGQTELLKNGTMICRVPDVHLWNSIPNMIDVLSIFNSAFMSIQLFKTPWGEKPKYYLIANGPSTYEKQTITSIMKFMKLNNPCIHLLSQTYTSNENIRLMAQWETVRQKAISYIEEMFPEEINTTWIEKIMHIDDTNTNTNNHYQ